MVAAPTAQKYPRNLTKEDVDRWMTELSNWGKWGQDDQAGTINLITPAKRKAAAALVKEGVSVSASLDADLPKEGSTGGPLGGRGGGGEGKGAGGRQLGGGRGPEGRGGRGGPPVERPTWSLASRPPGPDPRPLAAYVTDTISVSYHGNNTTHLDSLAHLYFKGQIYNGYPQTSYTDRGAGKDDVMAFKNGIFTRGVLFDIPKLKGVPYLGDDEPIYPEDLEAWEKKAGFRLESGDAMLVRTGRWLRVKEKGPLNLNVGHAWTLRFLLQVDARARSGHPGQRRGAGREAFARGRSEPADPPDRDSGDGLAADRQLHPGGAGRGRRQAAPMDVPADHQPAASPRRHGRPGEPHRDVLRRCWS